MASSAYLNFDGTELHFDAVTNETSELSATVTEHAVEEGADVADHIRDGLDKVTLEVIVTNAPVTDVNNLYGGSFDGKELDVPKYEPPLSPTPGALFQAVGNALGSLFGGDEATKATVLTWPTKFNSVRDAVNTLLGWKEDGVVGEVILPYKTYPSMVLERVSVVRSAQTGDAATISLELKEIRLVESQMVTAPKEPMGATKKPKGRQGTTVRDTPKKKSLLAKFTRG